MISWGVGLWGGKQDPDAGFTRCRPQVLGGPVLGACTLGPAWQREQGAIHSYPCKVGLRESSTQVRATTTDHVWPQRMFQVLANSGAEIVLTHLLGCVSPRFWVCNNRRQKRIPNSGKLNIPARLAGGASTRFNLI